jgi:hypothetical protein
MAAMDLVFYHLQLFGWFVMAVILWVAEFVYRGILSGRSGRSMVCAMLVIPSAPPTVIIRGYLPLGLDGSGALNILPPISWKSCSHEVGGRELQSVFEPPG